MPTDSFHSMFSSKPASTVSTSPRPNASYRPRTKAMLSSLMRILSLGPSTLTRPPPKRQRTAAKPAGGRLGGGAAVVEPVEDVQESLKLRLMVRAGVLAE